MYIWSRHRCQGQGKPKQKIIVNHCVCKIIFHILAYTLLIQKEIGGDHHDISEFIFDVKGNYSASPLPSRSFFRSTPVGAASNDGVSYFIPFVGYTGGRPSYAIITDVETRGDLDLSSEFIDLRVSV